MDVVVVVVMVAVAVVVAVAVAARHLEPGGLGLAEVGEGAVDRLDRLGDEEGVVRAAQRRAVMSVVSVVAVGVAREAGRQQREAGQQRSNGAPASSPRR